MGLEAVLPVARSSGAEIGFERRAGDRLGRDRRPLVELGSGFEMDDVEDPAPRRGDRAAELSGDDSVLSFDMSAQRQLEGELAH